MASVTFSASVGGDGSTVTDDSSPSTGLDAGGHRTRFVPCLAQTVAVAAYTVGRANAAASSASAAATSASNAASSASSATTSKNAAATSATNAANSASSAAATVASAIAAAFPVGAIYITAGNTNPGTFLGGTWSQIAQGRTLIGVGTLGTDTYAAGDTGGAARVTLTTTEMPSHNHGGATKDQSHDHTHTGYTNTQGDHSHSVTFEDGIVLSGAAGAGTRRIADAQLYGSGANKLITQNSGGHAHNIYTGGVSNAHAHEINAQGGGGAHENRMPYLAVYFWQRTA